MKNNILRSYALRTYVTACFALIGTALVGTVLEPAPSGAQAAEKKATTSAASKTPAKSANQKDPRTAQARTPTTTNTKNNEQRATAAKKPKVTTAQLKDLVQERLSRNPYYSPGFLLSHSDVEPIFNYLLEKGITIAEDHEALYDNILPANAPLVKLLKSPDGRVFMKKIGNNAEAYERLERLSWTHDGRALIERFLQNKDGYTQFQQLKTPAIIARLSKEIAKDPRTQDFEQPTGHIHTASELLKYLDAALARQSQ